MCNNLLDKLKYNGINDNKKQEYEQLNMTEEKIKKLKESVYRYNYQDKPFLDFYKNQQEPLIFKNSIFDDISEDYEKNFIIDADVCKCVIGLVFSDYDIDYETIKINQVYQILGYLQFFKKKSISKNGFIHHYGIFDINKQEQVIHLYSQDIPESYFGLSSFKPLNTATVEYCYTDFEGDQYVVPVIGKKYKTVHITMQYLIDIFDTGILEFLDIFTLSKVISSVVSNP